MALPDGNSYCALKLGISGTWEHANEKARDGRGKGAPYGGPSFLAEPHRPRDTQHLKMRAQDWGLYGNLNVCRIDRIGKVESRPHLIRVSEGGLSIHSSCGLAKLCGGAEFP